MTILKRAALALMALAFLGCALKGQDFVMVPAPAGGATLLPASGGIGIEKGDIVAVAVPLNNIKEFDAFGVILVNKRRNWVSIYPKECILLDQRGNERKPLKREEVESELRGGFKPTLPLPFSSEALRWRREVVMAEETPRVRIEHPDKLSILPNHKLTLYLFFKKLSTTSSQLTLIIPNLVDEKTGEKLSFAFRFRVERR